MRSVVVTLDRRVSSDMIELLRLAIESRVLVAGQAPWTAFSIEPAAMPRCVDILSELMWEFDATPIDDCDQKLQETRDPGANTDTRR